MGVVGPPPFLRFSEDVAPQDLEGRRRVTRRPRPAEAGAAGRSGRPPHGAEGRRERAAGRERAERLSVGGGSA